MQSNYDLLRRAIRHRQPVSAFYEGHERHLCPHVLGTKQGEARVLAFCTPAEVPQCCRSAESGAACGFRA